MNTLKNTAIRVKDFALRHKFWTIGAVLVLVVATFFIFRPSAPAQFEYVTVEAKTLKTSVEGSGSVSTQSQVNLKSNVSGKITEVAKTLGITSSAATQLVDELVGKGYITRDEGTSDRRVLALKLSDKSNKQMEKMKADSSRWFTEMFDCLSDKELAQYAALNKKIRTAS